MFCEEPVIAVYEGMSNGDDGNFFLDCYHDLAYHVSQGCRLVLETENYYISLGVNGPILIDKNSLVDALQESWECLMPCHEFLENQERTDYEHTLFVGERLKSVKENNGSFLLTFDDFLLELIPYTSEDDVPSLRNHDCWSFNHLYGCERWIHRKCSCGGTGELLLDFVGDYVVRCAKCQKSTVAKIYAIDAIKEWETGRTDIDLTGITVE